MNAIGARAVRVGGCLEATFERRADGTMLLRSTEPLEPLPRLVTDALEHWAALEPERLMVARREAAGDWRKITWGEMLARVRRVGQSLATRDLSPDRPVVVLSGNDLEHLTLGLAAMWVGVPWVPVSVPYSLLTSDGSYGRLREVLGIATPGMVFAAGVAFAPAIQATVAADCEVVLGTGAIPGHKTTAFATLLEAEHGEACAAAHDRVGPETIAKLMFTSGSTSMPKAVVNTHRMICASLQMQRQCLRFLEDEPPILVDWMPWNHTGGGNFNLGMVLNNGGTFYIDDGKPLPGMMGETLRNLREISPTVYLNVPRGFEELVSAMESDEALRRSFFARLTALQPCGAGLAQAAWDKLVALAVRTAGAQIRFIVGLGMTETGPSGTFSVSPALDARPASLGLPPPGLEAKLVPDGDKIEIRFRGPSVMPGYWRAPETTAAAFDEEGFYRSGDAVKFVDPANPGKGLAFDGRLAEDFKLSSGTFVHVGVLRAKTMLAAGLRVQDVVVTGPNRDEVGLLVLPHLDECRRLAGLPVGSAVREVLDHPHVRDFFQALIDKLWREGTSSSMRPSRLYVMEQPASMDKGEATDKGTINQRAMLAQRAQLVAALYRAPETDGLVFVARR